MATSLLAFVKSLARGKGRTTKWEHDLFSSDNKPQLSYGRVDHKDLRLKLQKRHHDGTQSGSDVRDLCEKLSGTMNLQLKRTGPLKSKVEVARPSMKSVTTETYRETRETSNQATRKKSQQAGASVDSFLESLRLEKYSTAFQVEEVDMDALMHMTDDNLKACLYQWHRERRYFSRWDPNANSLVSFTLVASSSSELSREVVTLIKAYI